MRQRTQELVRVTRFSEDEFKTEDIADVRFVPLIGKEGWLPEEGEVAPLQHPREIPRKSEDNLAKMVAAASAPFQSIEDVDLAPLLRRIGNAKVVLLGEASHGTSEFCRMRERISQEFIAQKGFTFVAIEGDWPDAARIDHYVRHFEYPPSEWTAFARFPRWMWRNNEVRAFVDWMRGDNANKAPQKAHRLLRA